MSIIGCEVNTQRGGFCFSRSNRFTKPVLPLGNWKDPRSGRILNVTRDVLYEIASNVQKTLSLGRNIPLTARHSRDPRDACGRVVDAKVQGGELVLEVEAEDAIATKLREKSVRDSSVGLVEDAKYATSDGSEAVLRGWNLDHLALTLCPVIPGDAFKPAMAMDGELVAMSRDADYEVPDPTVTQASIDALLKRNGYESKRRESIRAPQGNAIGESHRGTLDDDKMAAAKSLLAKAGYYGRQSQQGS